LNETKKLEAKRKFFLEAKQSEKTLFYFPLVGSEKFDAKRSEQKFSRERANACGPLRGHNGFGAATPAVVWLQILALVA
jgi:hypothetical protein